MNNYTIEQVLPHDHPMIFLDRLVRYDDTSAVCQLTIRTDSHFYNDARQAVPVYAGIEYMAQCIAAFGNAKKLDKAEGVKLGFLVGTRTFKSEVSEFGLGTTLTVFVHQIIGDGPGLSVLDCKIEAEGKLMASAKINVFEPEDANEYLQGQK